MGKLVADMTGAEREKKRATSRAYYAANKEKRLAQDRARRAANPEKTRAQRRTYYLANQEKNREKTRARRAANPEMALAKERAYRAANPERVRKQCRENAWKSMQKDRWEADKECTLTEPQWNTLVAEPVCHWCGGPNTGNSPDRVHNGAGYHLLNCVPCCKPCNMAKGGLSVEMWVRMKEGSLLDPRWRKSQIKD